MVFLLFTKDRIQLFAPQGKQEVLLPSSAFLYQEVVDRKLFEKTIQDFFSHFKKQDVGIIVDSDLVYQKNIIKTTTMDVSLEEKKFFETIPFSQESLAKIIVPSTQQILLMGTNKEPFQMLANILWQKGWSVHFAIPLSLFSHQIAGKQITYSLLRSLTSNSSRLKAINFLTQEKQMIREDKPMGKGDTKTTVETILVIIFFIGFVIFILYDFGFLSFLTAKKQQIVYPPAQKVSSIPTLALTPIVTQPASVSAILNKSDIRIQILNGSGIAGQATTIKNQLVAQGFTNIQTGNAQGVNSTTTIAIFANQVPQSFRDSILSVLNGTFTTIDSHQIPTSDTFEVSITTGEGIK